MVLEKSQYTYDLINCGMWHNDWYIFSQIFCSLLANESKKNTDKSMKLVCFWYPLGRSEARSCQEMSGQLSNRLVDWVSGWALLL